jgi:hypothetical protein
MAGGAGSWHGLPPLAAIILASLAFCLANTLFVARVLAFESNQPMVAAWWEAFGSSAYGLSTLSHLVLAIGVVAVHHEIGLLGGLGTLVLSLVIREAYHNRSSASPRVSSI